VERWHGNEREISEFLQEKIRKSASDAAGRAPAASFFPQIFRKGRKNLVGMRFFCGAEKRKNKDNMGDFAQ
jgi:hypothetical protein